MRKRVRWGERFSQHRCPRNKFELLKPCLVRSRYRATWAQPRGKCPCVSATEQVNATLVWGLWGWVLKLCGVGSVVVKFKKLPEKCLMPLCLEAHLSVLMEMTEN